MIKYCKCGAEVLNHKYKKCRSCRAEDSAKRSKTYIDIDEGLEEYQKHGNRNFSYQEILKRAKKI
jgi:hypothetical protein